MEEDLIRRAQEGDPEAIGRLYEAHSARVYTVVRRLAGEDALAEDWAQEAWLRVFRALPGFRGEARFATWLHRIAVNTALHGQRGRKRRLARIAEMSEPPDGPAREDRPLLRMQLQRAIDALPDGMRRVLVLHDVEGYTHTEIGAMLGVSPGTCKSQLFKARAKARELLRPAQAKREGEKVCST